MMLQAANGQTGITPDPSGPPEVTSGSSMTSSTNVSSNTSAAPLLVTTSTTSSPPLTISPNQTNASTNGSKTTAALSLVTNSTTSFSRLTISPIRTNASTNGSLNTTAAPSLMTNSTTTTGLTNITAIAGNTFSCASDPPLCCMGKDDSCFRGCYCDVACLRFGDCCSDFNATCITGFPTSQPNLTNTTSTNETTFPIFSFSGSCSANSSMCCSGNNPSCFNGCFCDESCASQTIPDCCPDYNVTCMKATNGTNTTLTTVSPETIPRTPPGPSQTNASSNGSLNTTAAPSLGLTPDPSGPPEVTSGSSMTASTNVSSNTSAAPSDNIYNIISSFDDQSQPNKCFYKWVEHNSCSFISGQLYNIIFSFDYQSQPNKCFHKWVTEHNSCTVINDQLYNYNWFDKHNGNIREYIYNKRHKHNSHYGLTRNHPQNSTRSQPNKCFCKWVAEHNSCTFIRFNS
ncbi:unnamed protein product [Arctogadus glacialis]